jgi:squalene synthase HpnC
VASAVSSRIELARATSSVPIAADPLNPAAVMTQARSENFPVASLMLPRRDRAHLLAVYGFARLVDDIGDEYAGDRLAMLDQVEADLERAYDGTPSQPLIAALKPTIVARGLPIDPFRALIEANRRDQLVRRYETFDELLRYCALSANPVGELVLRVLGELTPERLALSDQVCSALQLAEHWQDVAEDYENDRIYLPGEDRRRFGVDEHDLQPGTVPTPALRRLIAFEVARAKGLLDEGTPLIRSLRGRPALAVAAFVAGGRAALRAIERSGYDVLHGAPRASVAARSAQLVEVLLAGGRR